MDRQLKHLMYRLFVAPLIKFNEKETFTDGTTLSLAVENIGFLRSSVMTAAREGEDPLSSRYYDHGRVDVTLVFSFGFVVNGPDRLNIG